MNVISCVVAMLIGAVCAYPQGYAWESSPKQDHRIPRTYVGLEASASYAVYPASLDYIERAAGITCCTYDDGHGMPVSLTLVGERWITSSVKLAAGAGISLFGASFVAPTQPVPLSNGQILRTEYVLDGSLTYVSGFGSASMRIGRSHVIATLGVRLHGYLTGSLTQRERIVSPQELEFAGQQPGREVIIGQAFLDHATPMVVEPFVQLGYDLPLAYGVVLQPSVFVGVPLESLSRDDQWNMRTFGVALRLVKGLNGSQ